MNTIPSTKFWTMICAMLCLALIISGAIFSGDKVLIKMIDANFSYILWFYGVCAGIQNGFKMLQNTLLTGKEGEKKNE